MDEVKEVITNFDIATAATSYSQVAGILAGFAFAAIVLLVERLIRSHREDEVANKLFRQALWFLGVTFVANVVVAVLWALISGETKGDEASRPTVLSFFATLVFVLAGPITVEAIAYVITSTYIPRVIPFFRAIFLMSLLIGLVYLWVTTTDLLLIQKAINQKNVDVSLVLQENSSFFLCLVVLTSGLVLSGWLINKKKITPTWFDSEASFEGFASFLLITILGFAGGFGVVALQDVDFVLPKEWVFVLVVYWAMLIGWAFTLFPHEPEHQISSPGGVTTSVGEVHFTTNSPSSASRVSSEPRVSSIVTVIVILLLLGLLLKKKRE